MISIPYLNEFVGTSVMIDAVVISNSMLTSDGRDPIDAERKLNEGD